jgi:hypothetical protein
MKKIIGISLIVVGVLIAIFVRPNIGIVVALLGGLLASPELLSKLTEKKKP